MSTNSSTQPRILDIPDYIIMQTQVTSTESPRPVYAGPDDATRDQEMKLMESSGSLDFWSDPDEDIYSENDGDPI